MEIYDVHDQYAARAKQWQRIDDAVEGEEALKARDLVKGATNSDRYIPVLPGHNRSAKTRDGKTIDEYADIYLRYAVFYDEPSVVLDGMGGLALKRAPSFDGLEAIESDLANVTLDGADSIEFTGMVLDEMIMARWGAVLVDYSSADSRAYQRLYRASDVTNWRKVHLGGKPVWQQIVLREVAMDANAGSFGSVAVDQYRVLELLPQDVIEGWFVAFGEQPPDYIGARDPESDYPLGIYCQQVWRKDKDKWVRYGAPIIPARNGVPLWFLPCETLAREPSKPPLLGIVDLAIARYRNSADLENGIHKAGQPTLGLFGFSSDSDEIFPGTIIRSASADADAKYILTGGSGSEEIANAMAAKREAIAAIASRMLTEESGGGAETPEAHELRLVGSDAKLTRIVTDVGQVLSRSFAVHLWWSAGRRLADCIDAVAVKMATGFFERRMSATDLQTLWMTHLDGGMSRRLYEHVKHKGGIAQDGYSPEQERQEAEAEATERAPAPAPMFGDDGV